MRPLRLVVEGLTSFRDRIEVDFAPLQLFAITGPTGAGKSSLLDAILLALFGRVPRVGREHRQLISDGRDQLAVLLEFEAGDQRYRIARRIRRSGQGQVQLERVTATGTEPLADRVGEVDTVIERILGIGYEAFVRSVVLPQGQFDAFLRGDPKERRALLEGLLGLSLYKRLAELAGERFRERQVRQQQIAERLAQDFAAANPEHLAALRAAANEAEARAETLQARLQQLRQLEPVAAEAHAARAAAQRLTEELASLGKQLDAALVAVEQHSQDDAARRTEQQQLRIELAKVRPDPNRLQQLATVLSLLPALQRALKAAAEVEAAAAAATARAERAEQELHRAEAALPQLEASVEDLRGEHERAQAALDRLQREHAALHLRDGLHPGDACPVCLQPVHEVPAAAAPALAEGKRRTQRTAEDLRGAERARDDAERTVRERQRTLPELQQAAADTARLRAERQAEVAALHEQLLASNVDLRQCNDPQDLLSRLQQEQRDLLQRAQRAREVEQQLQRLDDAERSHSKQLDAATARAELLQQQLQQLEQKRIAAAAAAQSAGPRLAEAVQAAGEPPLLDTDPQAELRQRIEQAAGALGTAQRRAGELAQQTASVAEAIARADGLRAELAPLQDEVAQLRDLSQLLQGNRFQAYVQEEVLRLLTEDGSTRLLTLSQGRYSLRYDGRDFAVVDHWNADRERSVRTLSGGETFQAALALALALAERIAALAAGDRGATALECLFVDEGFGALDPEALEAAVQALEALQGGQRMVGVITHLPELAARLPARLIVTAHGGRATVRLD